jgi:hypothetical protein
MNCTYPGWLNEAWERWRKLAARLNAETTPTKRAKPQALDGMRVGKRSTTFAEAK